MSARRSDRGFSLLELIVALAIVLTVSGAVWALLDPSAAAIQAVPEAADVQQRLRSGTDALAGDLLSAGTPPLQRLADQGAVTAAAVFPLRIGSRVPDPAGTFDPSRIGLWYAKRAGAQTMIASALPSAPATVTVAPGPWCPPADASCGFRAGMTVAVFDRQAAWDLFSVTAVQGASLTLQHLLRDGAATYAAGEAVIAEVIVRTYQLKDDRATGVGQLVRYDGAAGSDAPVVDHVVALRFEYFGDADPPAVIPGSNAWDPPRATYGPLPPSPPSQPTLYPPGETCLFARDASGAAVSRLAQLGASASQVPLTAAVLTDGPWCPDAASPNRYDADLLRIRSVAVSLTMESQIASLRGPAGTLFTRGGTARGSRLVPDRQLRFTVTLRGTASSL